MKLPLTCTSLALLLALAGCATSTAYRIGDGPVFSEVPSLRWAQGIAAATAGANLDAPLKLLESPLPRPPAAWSGSGSVVVRFTIEANGQVSTLHVLGDPPPILADATRRAVERWRFAPITKGGAPTRIQVQQEFAFSSSS